MIMLIIAQQSNNYWILSAEEIAGLKEESELKILISLLYAVNCWLRETPAVSSFT